MAHTVHTKGRTKGQFTRPIAITLVVIVVLAGLAFGYASPYIALDRLKRAADARDAETVNQYVDFPALRESLKQQVTGLLARRLDTGGSRQPARRVGGDDRRRVDGSAGRCVRDTGRRRRFAQRHARRAVNPASGRLCHPLHRIHPIRRLARRRSQGHRQAYRHRCSNHRSRRKPQRDTAASTNSSSPISMASAIRAIRPSCTARACSRGNWRPSI